MTKTKLLLLALCAIALTGCAENGDLKFGSTATSDDDMYFYTRKYKGHSYVIYKISHEASITHDPDCSCHEKGGQDND